MTTKSQGNAAIRAQISRELAEDLDALLAARDAEFSALDQEDALFALFARVVSE